MSSVAAGAHTKTGGEQQFFRTDATQHVGALNVAAECASAFRDVKLKRKHRYVTFKIEGNQIVVGEVGPRDDDAERFISALPASDCRYAVYDHEFNTADGRKVSKLYFVSWLPQTASPPLIMGYTHGKSTIRPVCDGTVDINANSAKDIRSGLNLSSSFSGGVASGKAAAADRDSSDESDFDPDA